MLCWGEIFRPEGKGFGILEQIFTPEKLQSRPGLNPLIEDLNDTTSLHICKDIFKNSYLYKVSSTYSSPLCIS